jgi:hypothetical protein
VLLLLLLLVAYSAAAKTLVLRTTKANKQNKSKTYPRLDGPVFEVVCRYSILPRSSSVSAAAAPPHRTTAPAVSPEPPVSSADLSGLSEPRTRPDISTAAYYLVLAVCASQYIVELAAGLEAADALRLNLANDHAAVASGDVL